MVIKLCSQMLINNYSFVMTVSSELILSYSSKTAFHPHSLIKM